MISKSEIKKIRSLNTKKGRELYNLILIEGKRLVNQVMHSEFNINKIWTTDDFYNKNKGLIKQLNDTVVDLISVQDLKKITKTQTPSGIIGIMDRPLGDIKKMNQRIIILDNIADPGNLGSILRTANWFGINNVVLSEDCVDPYNSKVIRSAMGSHFSMNIVKTNIVKYINRLYMDNFQIIAADLDTKHTIKKLKLESNKWALLMGSEAHGLSESVSNLVDYKIKIPQSGQIESLNVSVACGIFLYHMSVMK